MWGEAKAPPATKQHGKSWIKKVKGMVSLWPYLPLPWAGTVPQWEEYPGPMVSLVGKGEAKVSIQLPQHFEVLPGRHISVFVLWESLGELSSLEHLGSVRNKQIACESWQWHCIPAGGCTQPEGPTSSSVHLQAKLMALPNHEQN